MTVQTTYDQDPAVAAVGMLAYVRSDDEILSRTSAVRQLEEVTVDTAVNSTQYDVTINGTTFSFTSDASATKTEIRDGLVAAINGGSEPVTAEANASDTFYVESDNYGDDESFTISVGSNLSVAQLAAQAQKAGFGKMLVTDDRGDDDQVRLPRVAAEITGNAREGVAIRDRAKESNANEYPTQASVAVLREGEIWVEVEDAVSKDGDVYVRYASGSGGSALGSFRSDADSSTAALLPRAKFMTTTSAGELARVEISK